MCAVFKKVIVFGTDFGIEQTLKFIPHDSITAVIAPSNRPDHVNRVKEIAFNKKLYFLEQPLRDSPEWSFFLEEIRKLTPDLIWSNAYSMLIPIEILQITNGNSINVHWSLLPKNKGPNPIQWAIIKDDKVTGVTFHFMDSGFDTGDIIFQDEVEIDELDTWRTLFTKLEKLSDDMHEKYIPLVLNNEMKALPQEKLSATINKRITPDFPIIDFNSMADRQIYNLIRAQVAPLNGAYIKVGTQRRHFPNMLTVDEIKKLRSEYSK